jgi:hypothetical protein
VSVPDSTAAAAIEAEVIKPVFFAFLDIDTDPVRANSSGHDIAPTGTGDEDLDDALFIGIGHMFVDISSVKVSDQGTESVTATLSGLPDIDSETFDLISDPANWQGRLGRLWRVIRDASNTQQGGFQPYYTGYMTSLEVGGDDGGQTISVTIETYLAAFSAAPNRTYLDQGRYDAGDLSPKAAISIVNGVSGVVGNTPNTPSGGGGSGGYNPNVRLK